MNILYLHCHDAGRWLEPFGAPVPAPHLAGFAKRSTLFRQAFCAGPTCSPSRAALLTGMHPHQTGMLGLVHRGFSLSHPERHLAAFLKRAGFHTALSGIQHEFSGEPREVYQEIYKPVAAKSAGADREVADWTAKWLAQTKDQPFFLSCGFFYPHRKFPPFAGDCSHLQPPAFVPDCKVTREDTGSFHAAVQIMDECSGIVLKALSAGPHADNTLVIFTTDHGPAFPFMKCHLTDAGLGVTLMMDFPGNSLRGRAVDAMVSHLDVFPTICELTGLEAPGWLQGRSMLPLLRGETNVLHDELFGEVTFHAAYEPMRSIRTNRFKLIEIFDEDTRPVPANVDASPGKDLLVDLGFFDRPRDRVQLYDLLIDPAERNQLAHKTEFQAVLGELRSRLHRWMAETDDPLSRGRVPAPAGAAIVPRSTP